MSETDEKAKTTGEAEGTRCCPDICRQMMAGEMPECCAQMHEKMSRGLPADFAAKMHEMMSQLFPPGQKKETEAT